MRREDPCFNHRSALSQSDCDLFIESLRQIRRSSLVKTGTATIARPAQEGELGDQQHRAAHVGQRGPTRVMRAQLDQRAS